MPRISADALLAPKIAQQAPKLDPLDTLGPRQAEVWRAVVASMPPDYFSSAQTRLLASYCSAVVTREDVEADLLAEQARKRPRRDVIRELRHDLMKWLETENRLARSMRLTHQSTYHKETAGRAHNSGKLSAAEIAAEMNGDDDYAET
jgi:hypothetical protein